MTRQVVFSTPTLAPIEAFTIMGLHAKPNAGDAPIGYFGTGLKYAVAVALREKLRLHLFIGTTEYEFLTQEGEFRGTSYDQIVLRKKDSLWKRWTQEVLGYTTAHGKNWGLWQMLRELESNTRDEQGESRVEEGEVLGEPGVTKIVIEDEGFASFYERELRQIFLPKAELELRCASRSIEIWNRPGKFLFYRGLRAYDLELPSIYTYNFLSPLDLSEDRSLKYVWQARGALAKFLTTCRDERLLDQLLGKASDGKFESKMDFDFVYDSPSGEFLDAVRRARQRGWVVSGAGAFASRYDTKPALAKRTLSERWEEVLAEGRYYSDQRELITETIDMLQGIESSAEAEDEDEALDEPEDEASPTIAANWPETSPPPEYEHEDKLDSRNKEFDPNEIPF